MLSMRVQSLPAKSDCYAYADYTNVSIDAYDKHTHGNARMYAQHTQGTAAHMLFFCILSMFEVSNMLYADLFHSDR